MIDRRIRKTEQALQNAFSELIKEKELTLITIRELCERADINKSTFYLHYRDIYDLASTMKRQLLDECYRIITEYDILQFSSNSAEIWERILLLYQEKHYIHVAFIQSPSIFSLPPSLDEYVIAPLIKKARHDHPELSENRLRKLRDSITFLTSGFIGLMQNLHFEEFFEATQYISERLKSGF
ncbi:MAG: TetR/AcrR family transcriptional regulator [Lachnospiraceae bacterium]|nr:TetR/AcrR family transcriptional regulator [Lachnospiraceae bacterium]